MIVQREDGCYVVSEKKDRKGNRKNLGGPYSREKAKERLAQVEMFRDMDKRKTHG